MSRTDLAGHEASDMHKKKWVYYISRFTLIDEILGFLYWALAIYGIFVVTSQLSGKLVTGLFLFIYVFFVVLIYMYVIKRVVNFFKDNAQ